MFNGYEYMRQVTVQSVGIGGVVDENGRSLKVIGNMPIQPGDTVWTDGRIVYGHRPVRPNVKPFVREGGVPFFLGDDREGGYISSNGGVHYLSGDYAIDWLHTWLYTDPKKLYYEYFYKSGVGTDFYLDIFCTDDTVLTAEYETLELPFRGMPYTTMKTTTWGVAHEWREAVFLAINMYYQQNGKDFDFNYTENGHVYSVPKVSIKNNGNTIQSFDLSNYMYAVDKIKEIYLSYDSSGKDITRHRWRGRLDGKGPYSMDVFIGFALTQILHFHFTDAAGNWEMIILSLAQGTCAPHTIDEIGDDEDPTEIYSYFCFLVPVVYQVWHIKSNGKRELLQEWIVVSTLPDNGVDEADWTNARNYPVEPVNKKEFAPFNIDFGDCSLNTDLRKINYILDGKGDIIASDLFLESFLELYLTNPNGTTQGTMGGINSYLTINLRTGEETTSQEGEPWTHCFGFCPFSWDDGMGVLQAAGEELINLGGGHVSYFGRLSVCPIGGKKYAVNLYLQDLWVIEKGRPIKALKYPLNHNLRKMQKLKDLKTDSVLSIPGMAGLIESRTKSDEDDD